MIRLRSAESADQPAIRRLVRAGGINPFGLYWQHFVVAVTPDGHIIGTAQLKPHHGLVELASIAVAPAWQGQGIARRLIEHLLHDAPDPLWLMCEARLVPLYTRFGFHTVTDPRRLPRYFRRMQRLIALFARLTRSDARLAVMVRRAAPPPRRAAPEN